MALASSSGATAWAQAAPSPAPSVEHGAPALEIEWNGPDSCDRGDAVRAKVTRLLGGSQRMVVAGVKVSVTVRREKGSRYVAELETTTASGGGKKRLEGESCDAIALASSVVIALSVDPNASLDSETPVEEPEPTPTPTPKQKQKPKPKLKPKPSRVARGPKRETRPYLHGSVGVLFQLLKEPSAFTAAGVGVRYRRLSLELGGAVYQMRDVFRADRPKVGAELRLSTAELMGCYAAVPFSLGAIELCPGVRLEYVNATAFGVSNPQEARVLLLAGALALRGRLRATSWLSATVDAGVAVHPFRPTFILVGVGDVHEIPIFSPFARTGLAVEF